jgi:hypothetical protein
MLSRTASATHRDQGQRARGLGFYYTRRVQTIGGPKLIEDANKLGTKLQAESGRDRFSFFHDRQYENENNARSHARSLWPAVFSYYCRRRRLRLDHFIDGVGVRLRVGLVAVVGVDHSLDDHAVSFFGGAFSSASPRRFLHLRILVTEQALQLLGLPIARTSIRRRSR